LLMKKKPEKAKKLRRLRLPRKRFEFFLTHSLFCP